MNQFTEKRKFPRVQAHFKLQLKFTEENKLANAFANDISRGGIFLQTNTLLGPNDVVEILFTLPGRRKGLRVKSQVVRLVEMDDPNNDRRNIYGAGLVFLEVSKKVKRALSKYTKTILL